MRADAVVALAAELPMDFALVMRLRADDADVASRAPSRRYRAALECARRRY